MNTQMYEVTGNMNELGANDERNVKAKYYIAGENKIKHLPGPYSSIKDAVRRTHELLSGNYVITSPLRKTVTRDMRTKNERVTLINYVGKIKHNNLSLIHI